MEYIGGANYGAWSEERGHYWWHSWRSGMMYKWSDGIVKYQLVYSERDENCIICD
jgi:hypothetical protein